MRAIDSCTHQVDGKHRHGTHRGYACGCRCDDCRASYRKYAKRRREHTLVSATYAHRHIESLVAAGMTYEAISRAAGLHSGGAQQILEAAGTQRRIARRILAVRLGVTAVGVRRRLQALASTGWTRPQIAAALGTTENAASGIILTARAYVSASLAARVLVAYEAMWRGPEAPSRRALVAAHANGYAPPLAWDDDTIDDARVAARGVKPERDTVADLLDDLIELGQCGESWAQAAKHVGYDNPKSLARRLHRAKVYGRVQEAFSGVALEVAA